MLTVISLGAGVQSTTMALMAAHGEIEPMPDCAIFADTQSEPRAVYAHLGWLKSANVLPFPIHVVTAGNLRDVIGIKRPKGQFRRVDIPVYTMDEAGNPGGLLNRSCTRDYKIKPIERELRRLLGITGKRAPIEPIVEQWIGISLDEIQRMKDARHKWQRHRWPLIEMRMKRGDCLEWLRKNGYPHPPKSACTFCPFHADAQWRELRKSPEEWAEAVEVDKRLREAPPKEYRTTGTLFLHRQLKPLDEVDLSTALERGQTEFEFLQECEGMCGV